MDALSTIPVHGLAGGKVDEMKPRAGGAGNGFEATTFRSLLLFQMRLHIHARLGAPENDQIRHQNSMPGRREPSLI
jgi:hypothetical protein